jgi:hypothetical protein
MLWPLGEVACVWANSSKECEKSHTAHQHALEHLGSLARLAMKARKLSQLAGCHVPMFFFSTTKGKSKSQLVQRVGVEVEVEVGGVCVLSDSRAATREETSQQVCAVCLVRDELALLSPV